MRILFPILLLAWPGALHAAIIQGSVVEAQTGHPLARTLVVATPVAGTAGAGKSVHTNVYGAFELDGLAAGAYIVTASRRAFAPTQYGQKEWKSAGLPVILEEPQKIQIEIRLPRLGAIAGKIVDENDVGLPEHDIAVFRDSRPPVLVNRVTSDDRGVFRFGLLEPGAYLVRTASKSYEDNGYVPTFYKDVTVVEQARQVQAMLDQQTEDIVIRPLPGRLFQLSGTAYVPVMPTPITVTLVSDMGPEAIMADTRTGRFQFSPQAPGKYELNISAAGPRGQYAGYLPFDLDRDLTDLRISGTQLPSVSVTFEDDKGGRVDNSKLQVLARRKQLSGPGARENIDLSARGAQLAPGRWEIALAPNPAYYAAGFSAHNTPVAGRADGWNEIALATGETGSSTLAIKFLLSASPGAVHGTLNLSSQFVAGAPVFLEPYDLDPAKRLAPVRITRTDTRGQYRFTGLAPGQYRLLGTFEYQSPDLAEMENARPVMVKIEESKDLQQDLELYVAR